MSPENIPYLYILSYAAFGACVGSFLNVVIYRLPFEKSLIKPGSSCPYCKAGIRAFDNIPVLSWILLRAKCRSCAAPISFRYPFIEVSNAFLWAAIGYRLWDLPHAPWTNAGIITVYLLFMSILLAATWIDIDHRIIPDELTLGGLVGSLFCCVLIPELHFEALLAHPSSPQWAVSLLTGLLGAAVGAGTLWVTGFMGTILLRKQIEEAKKHDPEVDGAMGLGDVKLMAFVGALIGWQDVLLSFMLSAFLGAIIGSARKYYTGKAEQGTSGWQAIRSRFVTGDSSMPFGPFLCGGTALMVFFRAPIRAWSYAQFEPMFTMFGY